MSKKTKATNRPEKYFRDLYDLGTFCAWVSEHYKPLSTINPTTPLEEVFKGWEEFKQSIQEIGQKIR